MKSQDIKQLREALPIFLGKPKITEFKEVKSVRIDYPFETVGGGALCIYAIQRTKKRKISLFAVPNIDKTATNMVAVQQLLRTYGLIVTQDLTVSEESDKPLGRRIAALCQGMIAIDALARGLEVVNVSTAQRSVPEDPRVNGENGS